MILAYKFLLIIGLILNTSWCQHIDNEKMKRLVEQLYNYMHTKSMPPGENLEGRPILQTSVKVNDFHVRAERGIQIAEVQMSMYTTWLVTESKLINSEIDFGTLSLDKARTWHPDITFENVRHVEELSASRLELQTDMLDSMMLTPGETGADIKGGQIDSLPSVQPNGVYNERRRKLINQDLPYYSFTQNLNLEVVCNGGSRLVDQIGTTNCPIIMKLDGNQGYVTELKWKENHECLYGENLKDFDLVHISTGKKFTTSIKKYPSQQSLVLNMCLSNSSKVMQFVFLSMIQSMMSILLLWIIPLGTVISLLLQLSLLLVNIMFYLMADNSGRLIHLTSFLNLYTFGLSIMFHLGITLLTITAYYRANKILRRKISTLSARSKLHHQVPAATTTTPTSAGQINIYNGNDCILCNGNGMISNSNNNGGGNSNMGTYHGHVPSPMALASPSSRILESRNSPGPMSLLQNGLISNKLESNYNENYFLSGSSESGNGTGSNHHHHHPQAGNCHHTPTLGLFNQGHAKLLNESSFHEVESLKAVGSFNMISPNCWLIALRVIFSLVYPLAVVIFWMVIFVQSQAHMECQGVSTCKTSFHS